MLLTREAILAVDDCSTMIVDVPKWGVGAQIKLKALTIAEQIEYEKEVSTKKDASDNIFTMLVMCCVNDDNSRMFTKDDLNQLKQKNSSTILELFQACLKINKLDPASVENLAKN